MSAWIEWSGGECPVDSMALVDTTKRNGARVFGFPPKRWVAGHWDRADHERSTDIVAYRVVSPWRRMRGAALACWPG